MNDVTKKRRRFDRNKIHSDEYYRNQFHTIKVGHDGWAMTLCPFHADRNPSLSVNLNHGGFLCFACGESGDLLRFHKLLYGFSFEQAVTDLGAWAEDG